MPVPEAGGLTPTRKFLAIIIGVVITLAYVFSTAPHPVLAPQQIITPVSTPYPVAIAEQPTQSYTALPTTCGSNKFPSLQLTGVFCLIAFLIFVGAFFKVIPTRIALGIIVVMMGMMIVIVIVGSVIDAMACTIV